MVFYDDIENVFYMKKDMENSVVKITLSFDSNNLKENIKISFYEKDAIKPYKTNNYDFESVPEKYKDDIKILGNAYLNKWHSEGV